jgi:acyl carrier protein
MDNVQDQIKQFILDNFLPGENPRNLTADTELKESGILDSLSTLKLVSFLEERFKVEFDAADLDTGNLSSLSAIERLVKSKMAELS